VFHWSSHRQADAEKFRADLINIAKTTLSSKLLHQEKTHFGQLACPQQSQILA
jgi:T-complex protein 1 subunit beta